MNSKPWQQRLFEKSLMKREKVRLVSRLVDFSEKLVLDLGCAQGIVAHNRPEIDDLMLDLRETVQHARELTRKLRDQPQSVIMGEKPVGRKDR